MILCHNNRIYNIPQFLIEDSNHKYIFHLIVDYIKIVVCDWCYFMEFDPESHITVKINVSRFQGFKVLRFKRMVLITKITKIVVND